MKRKTLLWIAAAAVLVLALVLGGFPLFSRLYYGRSRAATLLAWQFQKDAYTTEEAFRDYLEEKRAENISYYELPSGVLSARPAVRTYGGLTCYIINSAAAADRLILYFPGGSFIDRPRAVHWQFLDALAGDAYAAVAVPLYPLLPKNTAADAHEALLSFYDELQEELPHGELVFLGDSAGGGLALSFAMQLRDTGRPGPEQLILLSPWVDVTLSNPDIPAYEAKDPALDSEQLRHLGALWAGDLDPTDPLASPLYGSFEDLCPITLFVGTGELLYPDILRLDALLTESGAEHETIVQTGMFHVWPLYKSYHIPEAESAYAQILQRLTDGSDGGEDP